MKAQTVMLVIAVFFITVIFISLAEIIFPSNRSVKHICIDETHRDCDGACVCDGMECGTHQHDGKVCQYEGMECPTLQRSNKAIQYVNACDYQMELVEDSIIFWDGNRYVGTLPMWDNSPLDSLLQKDNE